ncbi:DEKNAAC103817 [Brettanomyces naardenensis]|uniref:DEKNAAC103817 n=1 Tax=Brettanomyces naardenensis TaxID=13370 RepID=A0A448YPG5_BRENA|nr:DEKNAAC103817 [Brettanomyces naardenensis]
MKVFITGATGTVGKLVVDELLKNGYSVVGLARSDKSADALKAKGVSVIRGGLQDLESLRTGAATSDAVIHLAFGHDFGVSAKSGDTEFSGMAEAIEIDRKATEAMLSVLEGTNKAFIHVNGILYLQSSKEHPADENSPYMEVRSSPSRAPNERAALEYAKKGVRVLAVRIPLVYGKGDDHGLIAIMVGMSKKMGGAFYIGDGQNVFPTVNTEDVGPYFRLVLEKGKAGGIYNCVSETGVPLKDIAEAIGKKFGLNVISLSMEDAQKALGFGAVIAGMNCYATTLKKKELGWEPKGKGLVESILED